MAKGIVTSLLTIYNPQNTKIADYETMVRYLFYRWVAQGWTREAMRKYILNADIKVRRKRKQQSTVAGAAQPQPHNKRCHFIHCGYQTCDIPRQEISALYNLHLKDLVEKLLYVKQTTIYHSRPKSFRDYANKTKLH
jgi:hypothetical protein